MAELGLEGAREMRLVSKATACSDLSHRQCSRRQPLNGPREASLQHERMRRHADRVAEGPGKVRAADAGYRAEFDQPEIACQIFFDVVNDTADLRRYEHLRKAGFDWTGSVTKNDAVEHRLSYGVKIELGDGDPARRNGLIGLRQARQPDIVI
jgi:hypothetical protein